MQQSDKISDYLEAVRRQIRWKRAQPIVLEEIRNHITDQKSALLKDGLDEETAIDRAITEMGDPILVGEQLDRVHRPKPDWNLLILTGTMLILGLVIQFCIGSIPDGVWPFEKQMLWAGIAILVLFAAYFMDFTVVGKYPVAVFFTLGAITIAFHFFTGTVRGSSSYAIYPLLLFPTAFAGLVYSMKNKGYGGLILCGAAFVIPAFLAMATPSLTVLFLLCVSCLIILTSAVLKGWFNVRKLSAMLIVYIPTAAVLAVSSFMIMAGWSGARRIQCMLNPSLDSTGMGYMGTIIQQILSNSQLIGSGMPINGLGVADAFFMVPDINTDYLLTYLIYRFGWIAFWGIITLFSAFIVRAIILCKKQQSVLGFLTSTAIISTFTMQFIVYIASNLGFLLFYPLSLPLISYGKMALVTNMFLIGLLLSVFRTGSLVRDKAETATARRNYFIQYSDGRIIIDLKNRTSQNEVI